MRPRKLLSKTGVGKFGLADCADAIIAIVGIINVNEMRETIFRVKVIGKSLAAAKAYQIMNKVSTTAKSRVRTEYLATDLRR